VKNGRDRGALGGSRLSSNPDQLGKAVIPDSLPVAPETEERLREACREIADTRGDLLKALGAPELEP